MAAHTSPATATCKVLAMKRTADKREISMAFLIPQIMVVIVLALILFRRAGACLLPSPLRRTEEDWGR